MASRNVVRSPEALGEAIARLRRNRGLTQDEVGGELGIDRRYIYEVESGRPNLYARRLFEVLNLLEADIVVAPREEAT